MNNGKQEATKEKINTRIAPEPRIQKDNLGVLCDFYGKEISGYHTDFSGKKHSTGKSRGLYLGSAAVSKPPPQLVTMPPRGTDQERYFSLTTTFYVEIDKPEDISFFRRRRLDDK